jgi:hypothetical protein
MNLPILEKMVRSIRLLIVAIGAGPRRHGIAIQAGQKPSFSGTWIIQPPNKAAGVEQIVKQDDKTLSITSIGRTRTYQLNGVEHREATATRVGEIVMVSKAAWEGRTITITTATSYPNDMKTTEIEIWSIDNQGQLVIDFGKPRPASSRVG